MLVMTSLGSVILFRRLCCRAHPGVNAALEFRRFSCRERRSRHCGTRYYEDISRAWGLRGQVTIRENSCALWPRRQVSRQFVQHRDEPATELSHPRKGVGFAATAFENQRLLGGFHLEFIGAESPSTDHLVLGEFLNELLKGDLPVADACAWAYGSVESCGVASVADFDSDGLLLLVSAKTDGESERERNRQKAYSS